jgi:tetratricopeptide (TPR) repeat protein
LGSPAADRDHRAVEPDHSIRVSRAPIIVDSCPPRATSYRSRYCLHSWLDQRDQAFDDFSEAIRLNPRYARAYLNRSQYETVRGRDRSAAAAKDRAYAQSLEPGIE